MARRDSNELPTEWVALAEAASIRPSARGIAEAAGIQPSSLTRALAGRSQASATTVEAVATALRVRPAVIAALLDIPVGDAGWWSPPVEAHQMNQEARDAVSWIIRLLARDTATEQPVEPPIPLRTRPLVVDRAAYTEEPDQP